MPISYKNKIYTTLGTPTVASGSGAFVTNSVGVPAKDYTVKGKSIVWNQMVENPDFSNTTVDTRAYVSFRVQQLASPYETFFEQKLEEPGLVDAVFTTPVSGECRIKHNGSQYDIDFYLFDSVKDHKYYICFNFTSTNPTVAGGIAYDKAQLFDLTKMFGAGNEPTTVAQFCAMFPDDYYPYNAGELKSIAPTSVEASGVERFQMLDKSKYPATTTMNGVTFTNNGDGTITYNGTASTSRPNYSLQAGLKVVVGHKYFSYIGKNTNDKIGVHLYAYPDSYNTFDDRFPNAEGGISTALKNSDKLYYQPQPLPNSSFSNFIIKPQFFDLTEMFGAGNEPATPAEFWQRVPEKLYGYNPNDYKSANIPSSKYFPDGMKSAGSAYDEINFLSQKAIKRIGIRAYQTGDENNTAVMTDKKNTVYELATPVETAITPPLQVLQTFKGFTSFSVPNSLMQNGPLSVTYYAEGGANPEKGWLTSYKRKLYMGRDIEWNQLLDKSKYPATTTQNGVTFTNNGDGTITANGTADSSGSLYYYLQNVIEVPVGHKVLISGGVTGAGWSSYAFYDASNPTYGFDDSHGGGKIYTVQTSPVKSWIFGAKGYTFSNITFKPQLFDLTQMFGAGNEPATPEEFWSYFDHKLYPYNPGETQPLFKISRKSRGGGKHYTARWDKVNAAMVRLNDAASFPTDVTNFAHRGSINASYSNPFDSIYPWSGIRLCNIDLDAYQALAVGESITKCVKAWEGDPDFDWNDSNGVWRYRPEFWGKSWDDGTYRYFDVTDKPVGGYVHYPEAIAGRWHGRATTKTVNGEPTTCLLPTTGIPAARTLLSTLHTYAKNYGATLDSIYSIDADLLLLTVEYATMNSQSAIGDGATNLYRQSGDQIAEAATNSTVVKVLASAGINSCIPGAIFDIGTSDGGNQVGSYYVVSAQADSDPTYLDVTLNTSVTVTRDNYWSVHGLINQADASVGSKSGYIGTNGKCNAYYRGMVLYGNMWFYTLGAYENAVDKHIWIAADAEQADAYDALDTSAHIDTGLVLPTSAGYIQTLGLPPRSSLLALPPFCTAVGGSHINPVGDYFYNGDYTYNTVLLRGGYASVGVAGGTLYCGWTSTASGWYYWYSSARPVLKTPKG